MNRRSDGKLVADEDFESITLVSLYQRSGLLPVDEIDFTREAIFEPVSHSHVAKNSSVHAQSSPGDLIPLCTVRL